MRKRLLAYSLMGLVVIGAAFAQDAVTTEPDVADTFIGGALTAPSADDGSPSILELLRRGGALMYPLYLASFIMAAFGIERAIGLQRHRILPPDVVDRIRKVSEPSHGPVDVQTLLRDIEYSDTPIVRVVKAGLRKAYRSVTEIEKAIEDAGAKEVAAMRRNCKVLSITASVAPLLGLLGTVVGMIKAFMTVASREDALGRTELLASGIYQALVTTATGLCIAIPALILYHLFVDKVERLVIEMDDITLDLVASMSVPESATVKEL
jgi:biopolymer transport protein ExbB